MHAEQHLTFDRYRLDLASEQLWCGSEEIPLPGKAFAMLRYLVEHAGQLVSKAELFAALWPGTAVSDRALTFCIVELRRALGDKATTPRFIETVHRRGYRFIGQLSNFQGQGTAATEIVHQQRAEEGKEVERKLVAILSADVQGYSRLMSADEVATVRTLTAYREVLTALIHRHHGRVVDAPGDNLLAEFGSAVDGVEGAVAIQRALTERNAKLTPERRMEFRIGINVGDVVVEGERIYGDGVNIAARLEGLAKAGGLCISGTVYDQVKNKLALAYEYLGERTVKNIAEPVRVYRVTWESEVRSTPSSATTQPGASSQHSVVSSPPFRPSPDSRSPTPHLVGREAELAQLHSWLDKALDGERQIVFVTGELGIGKTTLIDAFLFGVRSHEEFGVQNPLPPTPNSELPSTPVPWISHGQCIEQYGPGEPYMPILEALGRLCHESKGERLISLLHQHAPTWLVQMPTLLPAAELEALQRQTQGVTRERMLREMGEAIDALTAERPLVLWLEDLHWSDASTLELLALLARRREPARLLVIGTYRPVDVIIQEHPLQAVKQELQLHGLCAELPLGSLSETQVAEYLVVRFPVEAQHAVPLRELAQGLHRRTDGNPLFMVTAVEDLIAQKVLVQHADHWAVQAELATIETRVPGNLQQLIEQQIERLNVEDRYMLEVTSVAGMEFSAAAIAAGVETETERVEERCEGLVRRGQFLRAQGAADWPDGTVAGRYSFLHALYQEVLYARLPAGRRQRLHQRIGERAEQAYGERAKEVAAELAIHFEEGRDYQRAVQYRQYAAESAIQRYAHQEAETHLKKSLELLKLLPETPKRTQQELVLHTTLALTLQAIRGYGSPEVEQAYVGVRARVGEVQSRAQLVRMLFGLCQLHLARAEYETALELVQQLLGIAEDEQDTSLLVEAHAVMGVTVFHQGETQTALTHLKRSADLYDRAQHHPHAAVYGQDPWVASRSYSGLALWLLGYPQQAVQRTSEALRYAQEIEHPFSHAFALHDLTLIYQFQRNLSAVQQHAEALLTLTHEQKFPSWEVGARSFHGWVLVEQGQGEAGAALLRRGIDARLGAGMALRLPYHQARLAEACGKNNQPEEGLVLMESALATAARTGEGWWEAELYRLKGELTLQQQSGVRGPASHEENQKSKGKSRKKSSVISSQLSVPSTQPLTPSTHDEAEACFLKAIEVARRQQAKSLELRATMSLARLWQQQSKKEEAHQMLADIYGWFTEGFDTKDLQEAKVLLDSLESSV